MYRSVHLKNIYLHLKVLAGARIWDLLVLILDILPLGQIFGVRFKVIFYFDV
jgi:hypothetical protein